MRPIPENFRLLAGKTTHDQTAFAVKVVGKRHYFLMDMILMGAVSILRAEPIPPNSALIREGNFILLALARLIGSGCNNEVIAAVQDTRGDSDSKVRSYADCLQIVGYGDLVYTEYPMV